jgi:proteasome activator subunit 4
MQVLPISLNSTFDWLPQATMEEEDSASEVSVDSDSYNPEQSDAEKQLASLKTYVTSVPYECESIEGMQSKLEAIVGKIVICAKSRNWFVLGSWNQLLQWYHFSILVNSS